MKRAPPGVPPLGDSALHRIERGVFATLDARPLDAGETRAPRRRVLALAMAGAAAAGALFVTRVGRDGRHGDAPSARAQISTTTSGSHIAITGATLDVAPQSAVSFGGGRDGAVVVVLDRGTVTCEVAPRSKAAPFIVEAGETRVTVIGTRFSVHRVGTHATVTVEHGLVEVADTDMTELVHAGERFVPGQPVTREALASATPAAAAVVVPPRAIATAALPATPVAASPARGEAHRRRLAVATNLEKATPSINDASPSPTPATSTETPTSTPTPGPAAADTAGAPRRSVQVLFELAAQLEIRDPEAALRIYGELAAGDGGWAASALFASARLEGERGQTARARALCTTYLQRFPRGPNADDARVLLSPSH